MPPAQKFVRIPVEVTPKGDGRRRTYTAKAGVLESTGRTEHAALGHLVTLVTDALSRDTSDLREAAQFCWDPDNRMLWVAVADVMFGGHRQYALRQAEDGTFTLALGSGSSGTAPVAEAFTGTRMDRVRAESGHRQQVVALLEEWQELDRDPTGGELLRAAGDKLAAALAASIGIDLDAPVDDPGPQPCGVEPLTGLAHRHWNMPHEPGQPLEHTHLDGDTVHAHDLLTGARREA